MRAERGEEAAMLLSAYQQAAQRDANRMRQRRRAIRTLFGVIGTVAIFVGCIAAVDVVALNGTGGDTMTLEVTTTGVDDENVDMEAQFGWSSIGYGWCSIKSSSWCMFSKDKEKCKENINCYKNRIENSGSGSGSGSGDWNATVGDSSDEDVESEENPTAPDDNPTHPLDLSTSRSDSSDEEESEEEGEEGGGEEKGDEGDEEEGSHERQMGGED